MLKIFLAITILSFSLLFFVSQAKAEMSSTPIEDFPVTDGTINTSVLSSDGSTLYVGGHFAYMGPNTGSGASIDTASNDVVSGMPFVDGSIYVSVPDNAGGWYIGGTFTKVGVETRNRIAHILNDGTLDPNFNPNVTGPSSNVRGLALSSDSSILYVGGNFTGISGQSRNRIAALSTIDGSALANFNPNASSAVWTITLSSNDAILYVGGQFTTIGGQSRSRIAALTTSDGLAVTGFNPNASSTVKALVLSSNDATLYVGGQFTSIGGESRNYLAALSTSTGNANSLDPSPGAYVLTLALSSDQTTLYVGGDFTDIAGELRNFVAALNTSTGALTSFNPEPSTSVNAIMLSSDNSTVYMGGAFTLIGAEESFHFAAITASTGALIPLDIHASAIVYSMAITDDGSFLFLGGSFKSFGGKIRYSLAAIDTATNQISDFSPNANADVYSLALSSNDAILYVGGDFDNIGGQIRNGLAAINTSTGLVTSFNPNADGTILALSISNNDLILYISGQFTSIGGQSRNYLAAVNTSDGLALTGFDPNPDSEVLSMDISSDDSILYVGGYFNAIGAQTRGRIASLSTSTGLATSFAPSLNANVNTLALSSDNTTLYIGGEFTSINGQTRNYAASLNTSDALLTDFDPNSNYAIRYLSLSSDNSMIYLGGEFTSMNGQSRQSIAMFSTETGLLDDFNPNINTGAIINTIVSSPDNSILYIGGNFTSLGSNTRNNLAAFQNFPPTAPSSLTINSVTETTATLSWTDNSSDETSFTIERSTDGISYANPVSLASNTTSTTISGLASNTRYYFRIKATNALGDSGYATTATPSYTQATNATNYTATPDYIDKLNIAWSGGIAKDYYLSYNSNTANSGWITSTNHTFTNLTCNTSYLFTLKARNSDNVETSNLVFSATTNPCPTSSIIAPQAIGQGSSTTSVAMNNLGNLGTIDYRGTNYLTYINSVAQFSLLNQVEQHTLTITNLDLLTNTLTLTIASDNPKTLTLNLNQLEQIDLDNDNKKDLSIKFTNLVNNRIELTLKAIEATPVISPITTTPTNTNNTTDIVSIINQEVKLIMSQTDPVDYFITTGTPSTYKLGQGERKAALSSFTQAYSIAKPTTTNHWLDILNLANGRWPLTINKSVEQRAYTNFKIIYLRLANMTNSTDVNALKMMGYGVRYNQARNLELEKQASKRFSLTFNLKPTIARHWNVIRAIAYSGVKG